MAHALTLLLLLALALPSAVTAQSHGTPNPAALAQGEGDDVVRFNDSTSVTWVVVPLVAQSSTLDRPLQRDDLRLTVDGQELEFDSLERAAEEPSTVLLFQDLSGSMANGGKLTASRQAVQCLLDGSRNGDRMAVVTFAAGKTLIESPITSELEVVAELADGWRAYGSTALHDAVSWIPEVRLGTYSETAAVLITDGVDNASVLTPAKARAMVQQAEVPVYVFALRGSRLASSRLDAGAVVPAAPADSTEPTEFAPYRRVLKELSAATGGRYFDAFFSEDIESACHRVVDDLRNRYTLSFPISDRGERAFRRLQVSVPHHSFTVRHRSGYVGRPPSAFLPITKP